MLRFTRWRVLVSCFFLGFLYFLLRSSRQDEEYYLTDSNNSTYDVKSAPPINEYSLTVVFPVTPHSLPDLPEILAPFIQPAAPRTLRQILLVSSDSLAPQVRSSLFKIMSTIESSRHAECSLRHWPNRVTQEEGVLRAAASASTEWLLLLEERGLQDFDISTKNLLLNPPSTSLPLGPRGVISLSYNSSCVPPSSALQKATYLLPPFVTPTALLKNAAYNVKSWRDLGDGISRSYSNMLGALVLPSVVDSRRTWCPDLEHSTKRNFVELIDPTAMNSSQKVLAGHSFANPEVIHLEDSLVNFAVLFSELEDIHHFAPVACHIQQSGHPLQIFLHQAEKSHLYRKAQAVDHSLCELSYTLLSTDKSLDTWLHEEDVKPDVIITLKEMPNLSDSCLSATVIRIPREDLAYSSWMSSLTFDQWRDWNVPKVTLSVITKDRPQSLTRLLRSIESGRFYGDNVDVRINLEQSSDSATMEIARNWRWSHGSLFLHHRIIHGGLLLAVVESWYPHSNDTYGLLLEDDVELSPLFYAWIKMAILRYRYGNDKGKYSQMFGISLYQPKNTELHPSGRRPFNAGEIFFSNGLHPYTPYLSQVPCSWGAVYFPEHWREFHDYLSIRFSESALALDETIVPEVRSNQWTKSWKKYFIELVYLRGYVMLYPNYPDFVSLSTNHLEVGSHVKIRSKEKRDAFFVPLMRLAVEHLETVSSRQVDLLDLPNRSLPHWDLLPTLNLTGALESLDGLPEQGLLRRAEITGCKDPPLPFDAHSLLCLDLTNLTMGERNTDIT